MDARIGDREVTAVVAADEPSHSSYVVMPPSPATSRLTGWSGCKCR